jgi:transcriptional regulator GlxA family with amidase domain
MLRRHFIRRWGVTPQAYRHRFSQLAVLSWKLFS